MREIASAGAPRAIGPYVQGLRAGGLLFLSGQIPLDPATGQLVDGGIEEQAERVLQNLGAVLLAAGAGPGRVARTTVYLTDLRDFEAMNRVYARFFGSHRPARATVQVAALPRGARIEIDAIAVVE